MNGRSCSLHEAESKRGDEEDNININDGSMDEEEKEAENPQLLYEDLVRWREKNNVHLNGSMVKKNRKLCDDLMEGNQSPPAFPLYPEHRRDEVDELMRSASKAMVRALPHACFHPSR